MKRKTLAVMAVLIVLILGAGPATAVATPSAMGLVRAPLVVAPTLLPMFCGSLCSPTAPTLAVEAAGGTTAVVPVPVAMSGGYISNASAGVTGLAVLGTGGITGWVLGLQNLLPWSAHNEGDIDLPPPAAPVYGSTSVTLSQRGAPGEMISQTYSWTVPVKGDTPWTSVTIAVSVPSGNRGSYNVDVRCEGGAWYPDTGWLSSASVTRTCTSAHPIQKLRIKYKADVAGTVTYHTIATYAHDPDFDPSPKRYIQTTTDCMDANGDINPLTSNGPETASGESWEMPAVACPAGSIAVGVEADLVADGERYGLGSATIPSAFRDMLRQCIGLNCELGLQRKVGDGAVDQDYVTKYPQNLKCTYGPSTIPVEYCAPLMRPPKSGKVRVPVEEPTTPGQPKLDPIFHPPGQPEPDPEPPPIEEPPANGDTWSCPGLSGVGLGDILTGRVVYLAGVCAINWAFVPRSDVLQAETAKVQSRLEDTAPYVAIAGGVNLLGGLSAVLSNMGGGCAGPTLEFRNVTIDPVNLCQPPLSTYAGWIKAATSLAMVVFVVLRVTSSLAGAFNIRLPWDRGGDSEGVG